MFKALYSGYESSLKWCEAAILDESADFWGIGLRPNFFSSGQIFFAELAQESWRDLAAVYHLHIRWKN